MTLFMYLGLHVGPCDGEAHLDGPGRVADAAVIHAQQRVCAAHGEQPRPVLGRCNGVRLHIVAGQVVLEGRKGLGSAAWLAAIDLAHCAPNNALRDDDVVAGQPACVAQRWSACMAGEQTKMLPEKWPTEQ